jgi:hypothetical protein
MNLNRELLEKQFTGKEIKTRKGNFGASIDYAQVQLVIQRLNDAFDGFWSFKVIEHETQGDEIVVLGELACNGITKQQFGNSKITMTKAGTVLSIGNDLKAAASDSLKKCATMFGVALHLYGHSIPDQPAAPPKPKTETIPTANGNAELPTDEEALIAKYRRQFFAQPKISEMDDAQRHDWLVKYLKVHPTKELTDHDWVRAIELARLQSTPMEFHDENGDKIPPPEDGKKELPYIDDNIGFNGQTKPCTKAQLDCIQKMFESKGFFTNEDVEKWKTAKAGEVIKFLNTQK